MNLVAALNLMKLNFLSVMVFTRIFLHFLTIIQKLIKGDLTIV